MKGGVEGHPKAPPGSLLCLVSDHASGQMARWLLPDLMTHFDRVGVWIWSYDRDFAALEQARMIEAGAELVRPLRSDQAQLSGLARLRQEKRACLEALEWRPDAILQFQHWLDDVSSYLPAISLRTGLPVWLLPAIRPNSIALRRLLAQRPELHVNRPLLRAVAAMFPRWEEEVGGERLLRIAPAKILAHELLRLSPPHPWNAHRQEFSGILLESAREVETYLNQEFPRRQLHETGNPVFDRLFEARSRRPSQRERPVALSLVPPDQFASGVKPPHHRTYAGLIEDWIGGLELLRGRFDVRVAPHPRTDRSLLAPRLGPGMVLAELPIEEEIANADLVVSADSNTLSWAMALGIPILNYDTYSFGSSKYRGLPSVRFADDQRTWKRMLTDAASESGWRELRGSVNPDAARQWGLIDGHSNDRIIRVIRSGKGGL